MKKLTPFICLVFVSTFSYSQSELEIEINQAKDTIERNLAQQEKMTERLKGEVATAETVFNKKKAQFEKLVSYKENFEEAKAKILEEINSSIKDLPFFQKIGSKASYYKCLRSSLNDSHLTYETCYKRFLPSLNEAEKSKASEWKDSVGLSNDEVLALNKTLPQELQRAEDSYKYLKSTYESSINHVANFKKEIEALESKREELKLIPKFAHVTNCNENTPEINLENEVPFAGATFSGAFHGIPRDNQDGIGSCYANAAKNLLIGLSDGKDNASFLDMALQFKSEQRALASDGLDGGNSCSALKTLKKVGYCPQEFAPLETGESNSLGESLFKVDPYTYMGTNISLVKDFINNIESFEKSTNELDKDMLSKAQTIIEKLKNNPDIQFPLPVVSNEIPDRWKLEEAYYTNRANIPISIAKFREEYKEAYKKFYPGYIKAVLDKKSYDQIFDLYAKMMEPFLSKYKLESSLPSFKKIMEGKLENALTDKDEIKRLKISLDYLKEATGKVDLEDSSFIDYCAETGMESLQFLSSLNPLVDRLRKDQFNADLLFDKDGKFKSAKELMQLTVAPSCINSDNRKKLPEFSCESGYAAISKIKSSKKPYAEKVKDLRERVVLSLMQGYPVGNTFPTGNNQNHINTIVGIRFDKSTGQCEYLIRESQNGRSSWLLERPIFDRMSAITEVRKQ